MPRDIPVGNGQLLIAHDAHYQIRDLYFPHVGQENHVGEGPCRFGVWTDIPGTDRHALRWSHDGWKIQLGYQRDTLATEVIMHHPELQLRLRCEDVVDFHRSILVRKITVTNLYPTPRHVRIFHNNDINMFGASIGDTAYFDPGLNMLVHYRGRRYIGLSFYDDGHLHLDQYATGYSGFGGAEGTWRDAEDGKLGNNPIAQGAVDSTIAVHLDLPASELGDPPGTQSAYMIIGTGESHDDLHELQRFIQRETPQGVIDRTVAYWRLWIGAKNMDFGPLDHSLVDLYRRSLLILRTQIDNGGAIIAANDSDIMQYQRDTYSYLWPRDGALVAHGLDLAGYPDIARRFYFLCGELLTKEGYFLHKYNPDGSPASSWHPWIVDGRVQLPIQEDETALVLWALWRHYYLYRDVEAVRPLWLKLIQPAADFMVRFRDPATGLPLPSYDLWEERWGIHAFTVGSVYGGLTAARNFAVCFGDRKRAQRYALAAEKIRAGFCKFMWSEKLGRFYRRIVPRDIDRQTRLIEHAIHEHPDHGRYGEVPHEFEHDVKGMGPVFELDDTVDAALFGIFKFHLLEPNDPRVISTMNAVHDQLWVKTEVGGTARYTADTYHRTTDDTQTVPGNPWFICTLWLADWKISRATTRAELDEALPIFHWVMEHALPSGVLAEQVHPFTNAPLSVSPLTWSHATYVGTVLKYLEKLESLDYCNGCGQPRYQKRRSGVTELFGQIEFDKYEARQLTDDPIPNPDLTDDRYLDHKPDDHAFASDPDLEEL